MRVLLFDVLKHLLLRKADVLKNCWKNKFLGGTRYIGENDYFGIIISRCLSSTKLCLRFLLNCFVQKIEGFYQSFLGNEVDLMNV